MLDQEQKEEIEKPSPGQKIVDQSFDDFADIMTWLEDFTHIRFNVGNIAFYCQIDHMQILTRHEFKNTSYTIVIVYHQTPLVKQSQ